MDEEKQHEMVLEDTLTSGEEYWYCPTCGRRMVITWQPWKKVVLEPGDMFAAHRGGKGGLKIDSVQIMQGSQVVGPSDSDTYIDDPYLAPWQRWLDNAAASDDFWN